MTKFVLILDTETCNIIKSDKVRPYNNLVYDIGGQIVIPTTGRVIYRFSYLVKEIFINETEKMNSAYYAHKIPQYFEDLEAGKRQIKSFFEIMNEINRLCKEYNIVAICAHNARFDINALNTTARYLTEFNHITALPQNIEIWDTMKIAKVFTNTKYRKFCETNNFMTKHKTPRPRMTAEIIYRYIINDITFIESHTALEDVEIESEILFKAYRAHKKMDKVLYAARA